ncbi:MAG: PEP-CTERM sorting domain-containing protein [Methylophilaceae bacterium]|nr:PEP-CTERM sorting domain-containing protein [Methylophilaceae bacterium]
MATVSGTALAPVPEPTTYAMMLLGLGFMGLVARRKLNA